MKSRKRSYTRKKSNKIRSLSKRSVKRSVKRSRKIRSKRSRKLRNHTRSKRRRRSKNSHNIDGKQSPEEIIEKYAENNGLSFDQVIKYVYNNKLIAGTIIASAVALYLTSSLQFDVNLHHINFLKLNFRLRKIHVQNLETRG